MVTARAGDSALTRRISSTVCTVAWMASKCTRLYSAMKPRRKAIALPRITHVQKGLTVFSRSSRIRASWSSVAGT